MTWKAHCSSLKSGYHALAAGTRSFGGSRMSSASAAKSDDAVPSGLARWQIQVLRQTVSLSNPRRDTSDFARSVIDPISAQECTQTSDSLTPRGVLSERKREKRGIIQCKHETGDNSSCSVGCLGTRPGSRWQEEHCGVMSMRCLHHAGTNTCWHSGTQIQHADLAACSLFGNYA